MAGRGRSDEGFEEDLFGVDGGVGEVWVWSLCLCGFEGDGGGRGGGDGFLVLF